MAAPLRAQISPGPLATAHASLEGPAQCTQCHGGRRDPMGAQCLACHKDINWENERARGFHGSTEVKGTPCASCHPDHAGRDFNMVKWPDGSAARFDHKRAGWALKQKHAEAECQDCHVAKFQVSPGAKLSVRKTGQGYTGLETTCASCHEDVHRAALGQDCTSCHDAGSWTITPGFNHDTTAYELTGKHDEVKCDKCHLDPRLSPRSDGKGHLVPVYKPVSFGTCAACHADPHKGSLGPKCADCHGTAGFKVIDKNRFDHDRTKYPLTGKHVTVSCAACHKDFSTPALKKPAFATCASCHRDAHNGTATLAGKTVDCADCHTVSGFTPSTYTVASHARTKYPLEGKHVGVKCAECHVTSTSATAAAQFGSSKVVMRPAFARCSDCHADDHGGQLKAAANKGECSACHRVAGWTPSTFDSAAHARTRLALDGRHQEVKCTACHGTTRTNLPPLGTTVALGKANFLFKVNEVDCAACHVDPHQGRFRRTRRQGQGRRVPRLSRHTDVPSVEHHRGGARRVRLRARGRASGDAMLGVPQGAQPAGGREAILARTRRQQLRRAATRGEGGLRRLPQHAARHPVRRVERAGRVRRLPYGGRLRAGTEVQPRHRRLVLAQGRARKGPVRPVPCAGPEEPRPEGAVLPAPFGTL